MMPVLVECDICGLPKMKSPSQVKEHNFCSKDCRLKWFASLNEQRRNKIIRFCEWCGSSFETYPCWVNRNEGRFCSPRCRDTWHSQQLKNNPDSYKHLHTQSAIEKGRRTKQNRRLNPEHIKRIWEGVKRKPNRAEIKLREILDRCFPHEWQYTGDGTLTIGNFVPDFINRNGEKALIELFGEYWHAQENIPWHYTELGRIMAYSSLGFKCLIIWASELKDEQAVVAKIKQFMSYNQLCRCFRNTGFDRRTMKIWNLFMEAIIRSWLPLRVKIWAFNHLKGNPLTVEDEEDLRELEQFL